MWKGMKIRKTWSRDTSWFLIISGNILKIWTKAETMERKWEHILQTEWSSVTDINWIGLGTYYEEEWGISSGYSIWFQHGWECEALVCARYSVFLAWKHFFFLRKLFQFLWILWWCFPVNYDTSSTKMLIYIYLQNS